MPDNSGIGINVIIFRVDKCSFAHADNRMKDILILSNGTTDGYATTLTAKAQQKLNTLSIIKNSR